MKNNSMLDKTSNFSQAFLSIVGLILLPHTFLGYGLSITYLRVYDISISGVISVISQISVIVGLFLVFFVTILYLFIVALPLYFSLLSGGRIGKMFHLNLSKELRDKNILTALISWAVSCLLPIVVSLALLISDHLEESHSYYFILWVVTFSLPFWHYCLSPKNGNKSQLERFETGILWTFFIFIQTTINIALVTPVLGKVINEPSLGLEFFKILLILCLANMASLKIQANKESLIEQEDDSEPEKKSLFSQLKDAVVEEITMRFFFLMNSIMFVMFVFNYWPKEDIARRVFGALGVRREASFILVKHHQGVPDRYLEPKKKATHDDNFTIRTRKCYVVFETDKHIYINLENRSGFQEKPLVIDKSFLIELGYESH